MSALNGTNGHRKTILHKLFGVGTRSGKEAPGSVSTTTSDGNFIVDIGKLVADKEFQKSANEAVDFFQNIRRSPESPTSPPSNRPASIIDRPL